MRRIIVAAAALLLLPACSGGGVIKIKDPGPVPDITTTTAVDFGQVGIKGVSGRASTTIAMGPGGASLAGTVSGPDGLIEGASVKVERFVGSAVASAILTTAADGTWSLPQVLGGRYRVRAWRAPDLAQTQPNVMYIQSSENKTLDLRVDRYSGIAATPSIAPSPPLFGQSANLYVLISQKTVDANGVVRGTAIPATGVDLSGTGYSLESPNPQVTDNNGVAQWRVRCQFAGTQQLAVTVANGPTLQLDLPACTDASTSSSPSSSTSSTVTRRTTTTARRGV